jgi:hypothetical protein
MVHQRRSICGLFLSLIVIAKSLPGDERDSSRRFYEAVKTAKAAGQSKIDLAPATPVLTNLPDLRTAAASYTVVLGTPQRVLVAPSSHGLTTWYQVSIEEEISRQKDVDPIDPTIVIPKDIESPKSNVIYIPTSGGQLTAGGVTVSQLNYEGIRLRPYQKYLFILWLLDGGKVGGLAAGAGGVFNVNADDSLTPLLKNKVTPLANELEVAFSNRLENVSEFVRKTAESSAQK